MATAVRVCARKHVREHSQAFGVRSICCAENAYRCAESLGRPHCEPSTGFKDWASRATQKPQCLRLAYRNKGTAVRYRGDCCPWSRRGDCASNEYLALGYGPYDFCGHTFCQHKVLALQTTIVPCGWAIGTKKPIRLRSMTRSPTHS